MKELTQIFLTPSSILFTALGVARTEGLKLGISLLGILTSGLWFLALESESTFGRGSPYTWLPILFGIAWVISAGVHGDKFRYERKTNRKVVVLGKDVVQTFSSEEINSILRAHMVTRLVAENTKEPR